MESCPKRTDCYSLMNSNNSNKLGILNLPLNRVNKMLKNRLTQLPLQGWHWMSLSNFINSELETQIQNYVSLSHIHENRNQDQAFEETASQLDFIEFTTLFKWELLENYRLGLALKTLIEKYQINEIYVFGNDPVSLNELLKTVTNQEKIKFYEKSDKDLLCLLQ